MENKNTIIAIILVSALWFGYTIFFPPVAPEQANGQAQVVKSEAVTAVQDQQSAVKAAAPMTSLPSAPVSAPAVGEKEVVVDTDLFRMVITNYGARIKEFGLSQYKDTAKPGSMQLQLIKEGPRRNFSLKTSGYEGLNLAEDQPFIFAGSQSHIELAGNETREIVFSAVLDNGLSLEKVFTFNGDRYDFDVKLRLVNNGTVRSQGSIAMSLVNAWDESMEGGQAEFVGPTTYAGDDTNNDAVDDLQEDGPSLYGADTHWTAFGTKYFVSILEPLQESGAKVKVSGTGDLVENTVFSPFKTLEPGQAQDYGYRVYMGPKDIDRLKQVGNEYQKIIDFGFFAPIARPLLYFLKFIYKYLGNYGLAIILLTVIIKAIFWPLTQKSYSSMKAMQNLQPEMTKVREKHKNDRERLNRELMELYKENRVNPLGGCLPMVVQIPVFFALYKVLLFSIELRHAPFGFWLTDLSVKDPYYITPIVMGVTMFLQQKLSPTTMDPTQAKIFLFMPIVFTALFLNFPSGLVIYWLVNNVLTIVQQLLINRQSVAKA